MDLHRSGEDYLETMLILEQKKGWIRSSDVAKYLKVSRASVSYAVRFLKEGGFLAGKFEKRAEFPAPHAVSEEESAIFDAAVGTYPMIRAKATDVAERAVSGGKEYLFSASDGRGTIKVYVLAEDGKDPVFTQVLR